MSMTMIQRLVSKDWYLLRRPILGYLGGGVVALLLLATGGDAAFNLGSLLMITLLIAMGMHVVTASVIGERLEHTLPFVMSLPVSIAQYTIAKVVANASIFISAWLVLALGSLGIVLFRAGVPHGLAVISTILLLYMMASYFVVLAVAIITETLGWTIVAVIVGNIGLNALMYGLAHVPSIKSTYVSPQIVWSTAAVEVVAAELAVILASLTFTFLFQATKSDFL